MVNIVRNALVVGPRFKRQSHRLNLCGLVLQDIIAGLILVLNFPSDGLGIWHADDLLAVSVFDDNRDVFSGHESVSTSRRGIPSERAQGSDWHFSQYVMT